MLTAAAASITRRVSSLAVTAAKQQTRAITVAATATATSTRSQFTSASLLSSRRSFSAVAAAPAVTAAAAAAPAAHASASKPVTITAQAFFVKGKTTDLLKLQATWSEAHRNSNTQILAKPDCLLIALEQSASAAFSTTASYVVVFGYGSIVFFNSSEAQQQSVLGLLGASTAKQIKDDYRIHINEHSEDYDDESDVAFGHDDVTVKHLDLNGLRVISQILAQTVGLEHEEAEVNVLMKEFQQFNTKLAATGRLHIDSEQLFKLVALNNSILATVLTQLHVLDRSDLVWRNGKLNALFVGLRHEFEVQQRFDALELKLSLMQQATTFLLEVLHNKTSDKLEWYIIILIVIEVVISLAELPHILGLEGFSQGTIGLGGKQ